MHTDIEKIKDRYLSQASFMKFFCKKNVLIFLDQNFSNGDITIFLTNKGGSHYVGKLRFSVRGKLKESHLLTEKDMGDLMLAMDKMWKHKKYEQMAISREEFLKMA